MSMSLSRIPLLKKGSGFSLSLASATLAFTSLATPAALAVGIDLDGSRALESGTDCKVGAIYRFGSTTIHSGKNLDVLVEITGEENDFVPYKAADDSERECVGFHKPVGVTNNFLSFWGLDSATDDNDGNGVATEEPFYMDLKVTVVEQGTTTPVSIDPITVTFMDLDTAPGVATDDVVVEPVDGVFETSDSEVRVSAASQLGGSVVHYTTKFNGKASGECIDGKSDNSVDATCMITTQWDNASTFNLRVGNDNAGAERLVQFALQEGQAYQVDYNALPSASSKVVSVEAASSDNPMSVPGPTDPDSDPLTITVSELPAIGVVTLSNGTAVAVGQTLSGPELMALQYDAPATYNGEAPGDFIYRVSDGSGNAIGIVDFIVNKNNDGVPTADDIDDDDDGIPDSVEGNGAVDTDGDGVPDSRDLDSDNDGLTDLVESGANAEALDTDNDGQIDPSNSFGTNGLADSVETTPDSGQTDYNRDGAADQPLDSDGDEIPDFRDLDSDDDSIDDRVEAGGVDENGDALVDDFVDADGNGLDDQTSSNPLSDPDTDNDGQKDRLDVDSDGDGLYDITETDQAANDTDGDGRLDGPDSDGDGIKDTADPRTHEFGDLGGSGTLDANGNGVPDYQESALIKTGLDGSGGGVTGSVVGVLGLAAFLVRRRFSVKSIVSIQLIALLLAPFGVNADDFNRRFYGGANLLVSDVEPDTNITGYEVGDSSSAGYSLNVGYDITPHWSAEIYYADLGEAGINQKSGGGSAGDITYEHVGVSAIGYAWNSRDASDYNGHNDDEGLERREGLSAYGRIGLGLMDNSTDLPYERVNDMHVHIGGGLEYGFENGFAARAEVISYDTDALAMSVGFVKRFGETDEPSDLAYKPEPVPAAPVVQRVELKKPIPPVAVAAPKPLPKKQAKKVVVRLPYIFFANDSAKLSQSSKDKLLKLAATMKKYPALRLAVNGHTDSNANSDYNLGLSFRRAATVKKFLIAQGIQSTRLQTSADGEAKPISNNADVKGRAQNRRVQFKILNNRRQHASR